MKQRTTQRTVLNYYFFCLMCFFQCWSVHCIDQGSVLHVYALRTACIVAIFSLPSFCYYVIFFPMYGSALLSKSYLYFTHYGSVLYFRVLPDCIELFYVFLRFLFMVLLLCIPFFKFMFVHCFIGYVKSSFDKFCTAFVRNLHCMRPVCILYDNFITSKLS